MNMMIGAATAVPALAITKAEAGFVPRPITDPIFELIEAHRRAESEVQSTLEKILRLEALVPAVTINDDAMLDGPFAARWSALKALINKEPTTMPGVVAWIEYLNKINETDPEEIGHQQLQVLLTRTAGALKKLNAA